MDCVHHIVGKMSADYFDFERVDMAGCIVGIHGTAIDKKGRKYVYFHGIGKCSAVHTGLNLILVLVMTNKLEKFQYLIYPKYYCSNFVNTFEK